MKHRFLFGFLLILLDLFLCELLLAILRGRRNESNDVMNNLAITGPRFGLLYVNVFLEVRGNLEVLILVRPRRSKRELIGHLQNDVRLSNGPSLDKTRRGRQVLGVAFAGALIDPGRNRFDLCLTQPTVVRELLVMSIGVPGWHLLCNNFFFYRTSPGSRVLVGQERHRRSLAGTVTLGAVLEKNRRHVAVERDFLGVGISAARTSETERD